MPSLLQAMFLAGPNVGGPTSSRLRTEGFRQTIVTAASSINVHHCDKAGISTCFSVVQRLLITVTPVIIALIVLTILIIVHNHTSNNCSGDWGVALPWQLKT